MSKEPPIEEKELSVKVELPKILQFLNIEIRYKKKTYLKKLKPGETVLVRLDNTLAIIRRDNEGRVHWVTLDEIVRIGEL